MVSASAYCMWLRLSYTTLPFSEVALLFHTVQAECRLRFCNIGLKPIYNTHVRDGISTRRGSTLPGSTILQVFT